MIKVSTKVKGVSEEKSAQDKAAKALGYPSAASAGLKCMAMGGAAKNRLGMANADGKVINPKKK